VELMRYDVLIERIDQETIPVDTNTRNRARVDALEQAAMVPADKYRVVKITARPEISPKPERAKIGRRQRAMLDRMMRLGHGCYPLEWKKSHSDQKTLDSLEVRGLVEQVSDERGVLFYRVVM